MENRAINITLEIAKQMYKSTDTNIQKLALSAYPELEEPKYPKFQQLCAGGYYINEEGGISHTLPLRLNSYDKDKRNWPTKELAEAALALSQLLQLRDAYNRMSKGDGTYYVIYLDTLEDLFDIENSNYNYKYLLTFNTEKLRDAFLENNKELLETAKPLL